MKYLAFGDIHGKSIKPLERVISREKIDKVICLADFDRVSCIHQAMTLEEKLGSDFLIVPGNHDISHYNMSEIYSGTMDKQGKTCYDLQKELRADDKAFLYIEKLLQKSRVKFNLGDDPAFPVVVIHGAYAGDMSSHGWTDNQLIKDVWTRLRRQEYYQDNFEAMKRKGDKIMIRGHDHSPAYVYYDPISGVEIEKHDWNYELLSYREHVITTGAWFNSYYIVIDTESPKSKYPVLHFQKFKKII